MNSAQLNEWMMAKWAKIYGHCEAMDETKIKECVLKPKHEGEHEFYFTSYEDDCIDLLKMLESIIQGAKQQGGRL